MRVTVAGKDVVLGCGAGDGKIELNNVIRIVKNGGRRKLRNLIRLFKLF